MAAGSVKASDMLISSACRCGTLRRGGCARPEGALHQDDVDPSAEFEPDRAQDTDLGETERLVQPNRRPVIAAPDDRDHLPVALLGTALEEAGEEPRSYPAPALRRIDIDRVFEGEAIARPRVIACGIGIAQNAPRLLCDEMGQPARDHVAAPARDLVGLGRDLLERRDPVEDVMTVDRGNVLDIVFA